jgi:hypothetical protein
VSAMKKLLAVLAFFMFCRTANAQVLIALLLGDTLNTGKIEFGLDGGLNLNSMAGVQGSGSKSTWNLGFYFDIKLKDRQWMVHTGVLVKSSMGADHIPVYALNDSGLDSLFAGGSVERKLSYFNVPIMIKYRTKGHFFAEAGVQLGLFYKGVDIFSNQVLDQPLTYKVNIEDQYHRLDAGLLVGVGYRLLKGNGINLGLRYYHGLADVAIDDAGPGQFNRSIYFTVGIPIGAGKTAPKSPA